MTIPKFWPKPIPRLFFRDQIFRNRNWDFFSESETLKKLSKVSNPRSFKTEMSITDFYWDSSFKPRRGDKTVKKFFLPQILAFRTLWKPPPSSGQALSSPVQLQSPGLLLTAPGAQVIDFESPTSLKMDDNRLLLEGFVSIVLSLHIFLKPHRGYLDACVDTWRLGG